MSRVAYATIDVSALKHNFSIVRRAAPQSKILAVIKAFAYGHGLLRTADVLQDADGFAIAHCEEAIALRKHGVTKRIVALQGFADQDELNVFIQYDVEPVIHHLSQIALLETCQLPAGFAVWLKLDTGMHRLGIPVEEFEQAWQRLSAIDALRHQIYVMTHFANADTVDSDYSLQQIQLFNQTTKHCQVEKSLANSGAILGLTASHADWVRPGIMLYGGSPLIGHTAEALDLKPVMTLKSRIISINKIRQGEYVGYGSTWRADVDTRIAVVGIGYGDGYPRHVAPDTPVLINGKIYPIVGRVSMDMICVDIGTNNPIQTGEEVILWGKGLPAEIIAEKAGTIVYELFCQVTSRVHMEAING